jgi:small subunit ribosomal protein S2
LPIVTVQELIDNGVHFGHRASRWNPKMAPYIHGKRNTVHIIDLRSTVRGLVRACHFLSRVASDGRDILFVGTKRGAKAVVLTVASSCGMPCVTERWLGGTLTNFETIRKRLLRLEELENFESSEEFLGQRKKDIAAHHREKRKLLKNLGGIRKMSSLPGALVVIDPRKEAIAVKEANRTGIPVVALLDTDCNPDVVDILIPGNDDSMRSVDTILKRISEAVALGAKSARSRGVQAPGAPGGRDEALSDSLRGSGGPPRGAKRVVVRRRTAPGGEGGGPGRGPGGPGGPGGGGRRPPRIGTHGGPNKGAPRQDGGGPGAGHGAGPGSGS